MSEEGARQLRHPAHGARASMEPRFNERGRIIAQQNEMRGFMLQWSLASMSEEGSPHLTARHDVRRASMEPRFNERGRVTTPLTREDRKRASMEPRFNERGRRPRSSAGSAATASLQWSPASRSGEGGVGERRAGDAVGASMEPRFNERGRNVGENSKDSLNRLQWSLASMSEEGVPAISADARISRASMEPRFNERGRVERVPAGVAAPVSFNGASLQ